MKGKTIRKLTAEQYVKIPVITWRNYREETRHESNPHLAPRLPWTSINMLSKSWEILHPHGLTMPWNTIKIPHIAPHRPGWGGGVGVSIDKCIIVLHIAKFFYFNLVDSAFTWSGTSYDLEGNRKTSLTSLLYFPWNVLDRIRHSNFQIMPSLHEVFVSHQFCPSIWVSKGWLPLSHTQLTSEAIDHWNLLNNP